VDSNPVMDPIALGLPPVPEGWTYCQLSDLLQPDGLSYGIVQPGSADADGIPILRVKNMQPEGMNTDDVLRVSKNVERQYGRSRLMGGEVLLSLVGSVGTVAVAPHSLSGWNVARAIAVMRITGDANHWVSYYLRSGIAQHYMHVWQTTTVQATLNLRDVRRIPVVIPPSHERDAIVDILQALDDKITVNRMITRKSSELAQGKFAASIRHATHEISLREIIDLRYGKALLESDREPGRIPVFGSNGRSGWHSKSLSPGPGIIIGRKGANAGSVSWSQRPFWVIDTAFFVHPLSDTIPLEYLFFLLQQAGFRGQVGDSAIPGLNREIALACTSILPAETTIRSVAEEFRTILALRSHLSDESASLARLRDILLPQLMSGEIRVRDAVRIVEGAT
jgi:type I restriction enzyme S subunit